MNETQKNSILVIDDNTTNIMLLHRILAEEYTVFAVKSGSEGIKIALKQLPDIILLDIVMPDMDGFEVLSALKNEDDTRHIPVIFISGLNDHESEEKGLLLGASDYITKPFSPGIVRLRVANQITIFNQMKTIEKLSMIDGLTQIPNRRKAEVVLNMEWQRAIVAGHTISILMIDIDHFKNVNDTYGHLYGDTVIKQVATGIKSSLKRSTDFVARWGGEEFIALLPEISALDAVKIAERIRKKLGNFNRRGSDEKVKITVSIGVYTNFPTDSFNVFHYIEQADQALYRAKRNGRNRTEHYLNSEDVAVFLSGG
ncbi:MAG: diguanylate cyclase [Defluviitaleaceae bacterium]|nr:diguanylate cyclase [Defluviitaleaceae bacterium]